MKKTLRIITLVAGIISFLSAFILGCIYLEDAIEYLKSAKKKYIDKKDSIGDGNVAK